MVRVNIISLRCPQCGGDLKGLDSDVLFFCSDCRLAYEPVEDHFVPHTIAAVKPRIQNESGKPFWAPFWFFKFGAKIDAIPKEMRRAEEVIGKHPYVWVSAFRMWRPAYFGNPGYLYTSSSISPDIVEKHDPPAVIGCARNKERAAEFVRPFLLSVIDRSIDVAAIDISCEIKSAELLAVPFYLNPDKVGMVMDSQINWEYSAMMFEDLPSRR